MTVGPSAAIVIAMVAGHLLAATAAAVALAQVGYPMSAAAVLCCLASMARHVQRAAGRCADSIVRFSVDDCGEVIAVCRDGSPHAGRLLGSTFVSAPLTILRWRSGRHRWAQVALLVPGNCDARAFRRLRVALAWQIGPALRRPGSVD